MMWHADISRGMAWEFVRRFAPNSESLKNVKTHVEGTERFVGVFWDDGLVGVYGAARPSLLALEGYIWLQASPEIQQHRIAFARNSLEIVDLFFQDYTELVGVTDSDVSQRWLEWLGAKFRPDRAFIFRRPHG